MDPQNPVTLLIPLLGIALILAAVWLTGGAKRARLDPALALRRLAEDLPGFAAGDVAIDADGGAALIAPEAGDGCAVVFVAGGRIAVRHLDRHDISRVVLEQDRLVVETGDFTHGRFALRLPGEAARWAARLAPQERAA